MANKPIEWRRFEPVELAGARERIVWQPTESRSAASDTISVLREFERILRENERLRAESSEVRVDFSRHAARHTNGHGNGHNHASNEFRDKRAARVQEDLDAAREQVSQLQAELETLKQPVSSPKKPNEKDPVRFRVQSRDTLRSTAEVVASYLFPEPTEPQVRLVEDALRSRGVDSTGDGNAPQTR